ncbi:TlpA family protein disulfide reductase [Telluribacter humicola]|uniref:TlpA family protein disulfide reductase n=1 Tax=Telluribacter humicola TaxID=1720261 RepID=UPI001A956F83|nr:TlpA disulfide reductase family protein [Telluribacter humicola]
MKINFALIGLFLCLHSLVLHGQDTLHLEFKAEPSFVTSAYRPGALLKNTEKFTGIPDAAEWGVFLFNLQRKQSSHTSYKKGYLSEEEYQRITSYKYDSLGLYKGTDINNSLPVLSALLPGNRKLIIPDVNFNNDFSDDKVYEHVVTDFDKRIPVDSLETIEIDYDYYLVNRLIRKKLLLKLSPTSKGYGVPDSKVKRLFILALTDEGRVARVKLKEAEYEFKLNHPDDIAANYALADGLSIRNVSTGETLEFNPELKPNQFFPLEGKLVKISNVNYFGDSASLIIQQAASDLLGVRQGELLPDSTQQVLHKALNKQADYTLIDFWGSWCGPCIKALPDLKKVYIKYKENPNFQLVSVAYEQSRELKALNNLVEKHNITWQNIVEYQQKQGEVFDYNRLVSHFSVNIFPTTILLDKQGRIVYRDSGSDSFERLNEVLRRELGY